MSNRKGARFLPFDSLTGFRDKVKSADFSEKKEFLLSDEQLNEINEVINYATVNKLTITFYLWVDNEEVIKSGVIKRYDLETNELVLNTKERINPLLIIKAVV